jgi:hypothetical protein
MERIKGILALPNWMKWAGSMMIQGLIAGFAPAALLAHVGSIAQRVIAAFRKPTKINSPLASSWRWAGSSPRGSRLASRAVAITPSGPWDVPSVAGAGAISLSSPRRASGTAPITIHIHQQPGEDAQALAERVGRILERKGKGHGAFADDF